MDKLGDIAREYVQLVLAVGEHDPDYVDAYYGPSAWQQQARDEARTLEAIRARIAELRQQLPEQEPEPAVGDETARNADTQATAQTCTQARAQRTSFLRQQLRALAARADQLAGTRFTFDEETRFFYGVTVEREPEQRFLDLQHRLDRCLPGVGELAKRLENFRAEFTIPIDRLPKVFEAALEHCRARTRQHLTLPQGESFDVSFVRGQPWSAYNWYHGDFRSSIEVNTDLSLYVDRILDLASHEGYPGHHVHSTLQEHELVRQHGWTELCIYPLLSPQSLIAEGIANYGIQLLWPGDERMSFEAEEIWPLAGLDPQRMPEYYGILGLLNGLSYAGHEAARRYLDGELSTEETIHWLTTYALTPPERAAHRLQFIDRYRCYIVNYNLGESLVRRHVEASGSSLETRWRTFGELLCSARLPADLQVRDPLPLSSDS